MPSWGATVAFIAIPVSLVIGTGIAVFLCILLWKWQNDLSPDRTYQAIKKIQSDITEIKKKLEKEGEEDASRKRKRYRRKLPATPTTIMGLRSR